MVSLHSYHGYFYVRAVDGSFSDFALLFSRCLQSELLWNDFHFIMGRNFPDGYSLTMYVFRCLMLENYFRWSTFKEQMK